jgi:DHA2 family methylenomycin A resistance protein-like MFS transporter
MAGFAVFTAASAACAAAPSLALLIAARAAQGLGAAALVPCSLTLLTHAYRQDADRAKAVALWAAGASVALAVGPLAGGILIHGIGWRSIFLINLPIGIAGVWLTLRHAADTSRVEARSLDLPGQIAVIVTLGALAAATIESGRLGALHPLVIAGFVAAAVAAPVFVAIEARQASPLLPLPLFKNPTFSAATAVGLLVNVAYYGLIFVLSLFFQQAKGYAALAAGLAFVPMTAGVLATNLVAGHVAAKLGPRPPMILGQVVFIAGCLCLLGITPATRFGSICWPLLLIGGGLGLVVPPMTSAVLGAVAPEKSGVASGTLNATRQAGSVIGVAAFGSIFASQSSVALGMRDVLAASAVLLLIGCALAGGFVGRAPRGR